MNAVLDELEQEGVPRAVVTANLPTGAIQASTRIDAIHLRHAWRKAAFLSNDPLLGVKVGVRLPLQASNVLAVLGAHSPTAAEALRHLVRYQGLLSEGGRLVLTRTADDGVELLYRPAADVVPMHPLQIDSVIASVVTKGPRPSRVSLVGQRAAAAGAFSALLASDVVTGAHTASIVYARETLERDVPGADVALRDIGVAYAETLMFARDREQTLIERVHIVIGRLGAGQSTVEAIACDLGLTARTLQRRLAAAGSSFRQLLDEYRMREALSLIRNSRMSIDTIGKLLGYSEASAFSHAVSAYWGKSPRALRREIVGQALPGFRRNVAA
jgi:AraC-like DNA-binding protein